MKKNRLDPPSFNENLSILNYSVTELYNFVNRLVDGLVKVEKRLTVLEETKASKERMCENCIHATLVLPPDVHTGCPIISATKPTIVCQNRQAEYYFKKTLSSKDICAKWEAR
jgi:hypothetical protein